MFLEVTVVSGVKSVESFGILVYMWSVYDVVDVMTCVVSQEGNKEEGGEREVSGTKRSWIHRIILESFV